MTKDMAQYCTLILTAHDVSTGCAILLPEGIQITTKYYSGKLVSLTVIWWSYKGCGKVIR